VSLRSRWPRGLEATLEALERAGLSALLVGGAVRDQLLDRPLRDLDLFVDADPAEILRAVPRVVAIEAHTPVVKVLPLAGEPGVEITTPRPGAGDLREDLERRDFTINAIAFDPRSGTYVDPTGGRSDLQARVLRTRRPSSAFREDPIRILRGLRLAEELSLEVEPATRHAMERDAALLAHAPGERSRDELLRILELPRPSRAIDALRRNGALAALLPELLRLVGVSQNAHHRDDVYRHSLSVCDATPARPLLRLAALLHDVAKPETKRWSEPKRDFTFLRHDVGAAGHLERVAARLRLSRRQLVYLKRLVRHHLLFPRQLETGAAVRRMLRRVGIDILGDLLDLRGADLASRTSHGRTPSDWRATAERIVQEAGRHRAKPQEPLAIGGKDIMRELGIQEGPEVGRWLRRARRRVTELPEANDAERLLAWIRESRAREEP
jgi:tRNA nucleotidyltransferase/poly(A) polymerase